MGAWRASLPANCANRGFAGTTVPGHFAPTGPVLGRLLRAGPVPAHFAPASPLLGAFARARSLPAHLVRTGPFAFAWAAQVLGHFPRPVLGHFVRAVRA